jgi:uncharacterized membrane protein (UPF0182 family)
MGNNLVYADTYPEALAQLAGENVPAPQTTAQQPATPASATPAGAAAPTTPDVRIVEIRRHFDRYRELVSQGKLSEAGRELEAIQALVAK